MFRVFSGHFTLHQALMRPFEEKQRLVGGQMVDQVLREFRHFCAAELGAPNCDESLSHSAYAYDGLWALGLALNRSLGEGADEPPDKSKLLKAMWATDFQGLSGRVRFDESGERLGLVQIEQWNNGKFTIFLQANCNWICRFLLVHWLLGQCRGKIPTTQKYP
jgi:hypothetical protein